MNIGDSPRAEFVLDVLEKTTAIPPAVCLLLVANAKVQRFVVHGAKRILCI